MDKQITELLTESSGEFENFVRMSFVDFEYLLNKVAPVIVKQDTQLRHAIPPKVRLAITLRFLATGDSYRSLHFLFKVSSQLISTIIPEVCAAINEALKDQIKVNSFITNLNIIYRLYYKEKVKLIKRVTQTKTIIPECT